MATQVKPLFLEMQKLYFLIIISMLCFSCKNNSQSENAISSKENYDTKPVNRIAEIKYSKSFKISYFEGYKILEITNPWPNATSGFKYALVSKNVALPEGEKFDAIVQIPIENIVVTSTTHIPSLEMLSIEDKLIGFPNMDYISSEKTRKRISEKKITELGQNEAINTEILLNLSPDLVVGYGIDNENTAFNTVAKSGIPVVYNADWMETTPLGKAEWIKFFAAFFNLEEKANSLFETIENDYNEAKKMAATATNKPTVLSGAMYKDIWYMPQGDSWAAQFIADANGDYLWNTTEGTGSLSLNLEAVLEKAKNAAFWIGPGQFSNLQQLKVAHTVYGQFGAFKSGNVYSFTNKIGKTGGVLYYELAPNRPDLVLKDIIKILHPELLPEYKSYFFEKLN